MATSRRGEDPRGLELVLSDGHGHNYYVFERRVDGPNYSDLYVAGVREQGLAAVRSGTLYAIVFVDDNRNGIIDESELALLEVILKP